MARNIENIVHIEAHRQVYQHLLSIWKNNFLPEVIFQVSFTLNEVNTCLNAVDQTALSSSYISTSATLNTRLQSSISFIPQNVKAQIPSDQS